MLTPTNINSNSHDKPQKTTSLVIINPFVPNSLFLYSLKTSENRQVFWCFQGLEKGA